MEAYFLQNKATAMFADGHEYEGRVDVTQITAHDFKRFLMSDKQTVDGAQERKRFGVDLEGGQAAQDGRGRRR